MWYNNNEGRIEIIRVLAIDQSTSSMGYAVMEGDNLVTFGILEERALTDYKSKLEALILDYAPEAIILEDLKGDRNVDTVRKLAEITGVIKELCESLKIHYTEIHPAHVKSVIARTNKKDILGRHISELYNLEFPYEEIYTIYKRGKNKGKSKVNKSHRFLNITDAIALGLCAHKED